MGQPCKGNLPKLIALMDGTLRPPAAQALRSHLEQCPRCAAAHRRLLLTRDLCREMDDDLPPDISWKRVEAQLHWKMNREANGHPRSAPRTLLRALALAGTALAGIVVGGFFLSPLLPPGEAPRDPKARATPLAPAQAPPQLPEELAALITVLGGGPQLVSARGPVTFRDLTRPLLAGDELATPAGARVALQWQPGTGLLLEPGSSLRLRSLSTQDQTFALGAGRVVLQVHRRAPGQSLQVLAGDLQVTVKGTHLAVTRQGSSASVEVYSGAVQIASASGQWPPQRVPAGQRAELDTAPRPRPRLRPLAEPAPATSLINLLGWSSFQRVMATTGELPVHTQPQGLALHLNHQQVGSTDIRLRSPFGRHLVELFFEGALVDSRWIDFQPASSGKPLFIGPVLAALPDITPAQLRIIERTTREQRSPQIRQCYERALKRDAQLQGKLRLRLWVDREGHVSRAAASPRSTIRDPYVTQCALYRAHDWTLPAGRKGAYAISLTFDLTPR